MILPLASDDRSTISDYRRCVAILRRGRCRRRVHTARVWRSWQNLESLKAGSRGRIGDSQVLGKDRAIILPRRKRCYGAWPKSFLWWHTGLGLSLSVTVLHERLSTPARSSLGVLAAFDCDSLRPCQRVCVSDCSSLRLITQPSTVVLKAS